MYLIVGLGNPEPEYSFTRHNMGFDVINKISKRYNIKVEKKAFDSLYGTGILENEKVILCKPQTFMNLSGEAIIKFVNYYKIDFSKVIVIYDDIDLPEATVKVRKQGGAGTHNGMKSVINCLKTEEFPHIRIGTGMPEYKEDLIYYVLEKLSKEKYQILENGINKGAEAVTQIIQNGIDTAMNRIN